MSIFNDLKKLFFGAKAVGKSAAESAKEKGEDTLEQLQHAGAEALEKATDIAEDLGDKAAGLAETAGQKFLDVTGVAGKENNPADNDVMDDILRESVTDTSAPKAELELPPLENLASSQTGWSPSQPTGDEAGKSPLEETGEKVLEKGKEALEKAGGFAEKTGEKVMEAGDELLEKFGEKADEIGEQLLDQGGKAMKKAREMAEDLGAKLLKARDELLKKAEEEAERTGETPKDLADKLEEINQRIKDAISGDNKKFADKPLDLGGSELEKHDNFFEKAKKFAEGDYPSKKPKITKNQPGEQSKSGTVKGFEDLDGDGDEIIDDAIIDES